MRESEIEKYLIKRVEEAGGEIRKVKWIGRRGCPDRLVGFPNGNGINFFACHCLVELKAPNKKLSPHQKREIKKLQDIGFNIWVAKSKKEVDEILEYYTVE